MRVFFWDRQSLAKCPSFPQLKHFNWERSLGVTWATFPLAGPLLKPLARPRSMGTGTLLNARGALVELKRGCVACIVWVLHVFGLQDGGDALVAPEIEPPALVGEVP